jgi:hypothetical protein
MQGEEVREVRPIAARQRRHSHMWTSSKQHIKTHAMAQAQKRSLQLQPYEEFEEEISLNLLLHFVL